MLSHAYIITWEVIRRNRWGLGACLLGIPVCALIFRLLAYWEITAIEIGPIIYVPLAAVFSYLVEGTLYVDSDAKAKQVGFPRYNFLLPVSNQMLVIIPLIRAFLMLPLFYLLWALCVYRPLGVDMPLLTPMLLMAVSAVWLHAVAWCWGRLPLLGILIFSLIFVAEAGLSLAATENVLHLPGGKLLYNLVQLLSLLPAYWLSLFAISRYRSGESLPTRSGTTLSTVLRASNQKAFRDKGHAQSWYEWQVHGRYLPMLTTLVASIFLVLPLIQTLSEIATYAVMIGMLVLGLLLTSLVGMELSKPYFGSKDYSLGLFYGTLPMTSEDLARAKLKMTARSSALSLLTTMALVLILFLISDHRALMIERLQTLFQQNPATPLAACLLLILLQQLVSWSLVGTGLSVGLVGSKRFTVSIAIGIFLIYGPLLIGGAWLFRHQESLPAVLDFLPRLALPITLLWASALAVLYRASRKQGFLTDLPPLKLLAGALVLFGLLFGLATRLPIPAEFVKNLVYALITLISWSLMPLAAAPMALAHNRHR